LSANGAHRVRAHDDGAALALTLSGHRRNATHVRHAGDARNHQYIAVLGEVMGLELGHAVDLCRSIERIGSLSDVAHGERRADDQFAGQGRLQDARSDGSVRNAEFIHHV